MTLRTSNSLIVPMFDMPRSLGDVVSFFDRFPQLDQNMVQPFPVDIDQKEDAFILEAELPGVKIEDINISVENQVLKIEVNRSHRQKKENRNGFLMERSQENLSRSFKLSDEVNSENIKAELKDGILTLTLPKNEKAQPRRIEINKVEASQS